MGLRVDLAPQFPIPAVVSRGPETVGGWQVSGRGARVKSAHFRILSLLLQLYWLRYRLTIYSALRAGQCPGKRVPLLAFTYGP
eukprot:8856101-Pyramimonas_sp.AAC.1